MQGLFLDANQTLADVFHRVLRPEDPHVAVNLQEDIDQSTLADLIQGYDVLLDDHTTLPSASSSNTSFSSAPVPAAT